MAESFENIDNILHYWAKGKVQKRIVEALNRYEKQSSRKKKIKPFLFSENGSEKILEQSAVERD